MRPTSLALARSEEIWGPIGQDSQQRLSRRTDTELRVILDFLTEGRQLQIEHAVRIDEQRATTPPTASDTSDDG